MPHVCKFGICRLRQFATANKKRRNLLVNRKRRTALASQSEQRFSCNTSFNFKLHSSPLLRDYVYCVCNLLEQCCYMQVNVQLRKRVIHNNRVVLFTIVCSFDGMGKTELAFTMHDKVLMLCISPRGVKHDIATLPERVLSYFRKQNECKP